MKIYVDESGELGFDPKSSKFYVVVALSATNPKTVGHIIRKFNGKLTKAGWPDNIEIKAATLFDAPKNPRIPKTFKYKQDTTHLLSYVIGKITGTVDHIDVAVVRKDMVYDDLRRLPFGVLHNYYCGQILVPAILQYSTVEVFVDRRSKEKHSLKHFDGYIQTRVYEGSLEGKKPILLDIQHVESHRVYGIAAADYISWAVFRRFESRDSRFWEIVKGKARKITGLY